MRAVSPLNNAINLFQSGKTSQAAKILENFLDANPEDFDALSLLGVILATSSELGAAIPLFERATQIRPGDAEIHINLAVAYQEQGRFDEAIDHYRRSLSIEPNNEGCHTNLGNLLKDNNDLTGAADCFNRALAINPVNAWVHSNLGIVLEAQGLLDEAVASHQRALEIDPDNALILSNLGIALKAQGLLDDAVGSHKRALEIDSNIASIHNNLGFALAAQDRLDEAVASYQKALAINPEYVEAHDNLGTAFDSLGKLDEADTCFHKALAINPHYAEAHRNLGHLQLLTGNFQDGWENINYRWLCNDSALSYQKYDKPLWRGEAIDGKSLLVWEEQGVGDRIIFASMIPDLIERGADIMIECDKRLIPLYSRSFPAITCAATNDPDIGKTEDKKFNLHAPLGDAGHWLRADLASFPARTSYLVADSQQRHTLRNRYLERGNDFLVGIAWYSKSVHYGEQKSMTLLDLHPLLEMPGITFIDLQYGDTAEERKAFTTETGIEVFHDDGVDQMADLDIFASQVAAMDLVVTISNTTAHMAGALGIPTLLMLGTLPIWYWLLKRDDSPWYPSLRLFRQQKRGDNWQEVVDLARHELAARVGDS